MQKIKNAFTSAKETAKAELHGGNRGDPALRNSSYDGYAGTGVAGTGVAGTGTTAGTAAGYTGTQADINAPGYTAGAGGVGGNLAAGSISSTSSDSDIGAVGTTTGTGLAARELDTGLGTGVGTGAGMGGVGVAGAQVTGVALNDQEPVVCGQKTFTEVEDRPIVKERVQRFVEHNPVEKQYVVETRYVGEAPIASAMGVTHVGETEYVVEAAQPGPKCPVNAGTMMNEAAGRPL